MKLFLKIFFFLCPIINYSQNNTENVDLNVAEQLLAKKWILISIIDDYRDNSQHGSLQIFYENKLCIGILTGNCDTCFGKWHLAEKILEIEYLFYGNPGASSFKILELNDSTLKISSLYGNEGYWHFKADKF